MTHGICFKICQLTHIFAIYTCFIDIESTILLTQISECGTRQPYRIAVAAFERSDLTEFTIIIEINVRGTGRSLMLAPSVLIAGLLFEKYATVAHRRRTHGKR